MKRLLAFAAAGVAAAFSTTPAWAHEGNPNFRSTIRSVQPSAPGLKFEVLNYDDRMLLANRTGQDVLVRGYDGEPYVRIAADGPVEVNLRSEAHYLNQDRFAAVDVPSSAGSGATPEWKLVNQSGRYEWHDHRIHWMSKQLPPKVKDKDTRTKVFDWRVPIIVGGQKGRVAGDLYWEASSAGAPRGAILALAVLVFASIGLVELVRRRRRRTGVSAPGRGRR